MGSFEWDLTADLLHFSEAAAQIFGAKAGVWPARGGEILYSRLPDSDRRMARCSTS